MTYLRGSCDKCCTDKTEGDGPARHQCIMWLILAAKVEVLNIVHAVLHTHMHILQNTSIYSHSLFIFYIILFYSCTDLIYLYFVTCALTSIISMKISI